MRKLSVELFLSAQATLERFRWQLEAGIPVSFQELENELTECWVTSYRELRAILTEMVEQERYGQLARSYLNARQ